MTFNYQWTIKSSRSFSSFWVYHIGVKQETNFLIQNYQIILCVSVKPLLGFQALTILFSRIPRGTRTRVLGNTAIVDKLSWIWILYGIKFIAFGGWIISSWKTQIFLHTQENVHNGRVMTRWSLSGFGIISGIQQNFIDRVFIISYFFQLNV